MGTTVAMRIINKVDDAVDFIRATSDLIVYQNLLKTIHQPEYRKYQQWCDEYYEIAERFSDIYEYEDYLKKLDEWKKEHSSPADPQNGLTKDEKKQIDDLCRRSSYERVDEFSNEQFEIDKPHWLIKYVRHINYLEAVKVSGLALLSYDDVNVIVRKLKKCKNAESAKKEFPVDSYYHDGEDEYWKGKLEEGLKVFTKMQKCMNKKDFVLYMET